MLSVIMINVVVLNVVAPDTETLNIDHKIICFFQHSVFHMEHKASYCLDQSGANVIMLFTNVSNKLVYLSLAGLFSLVYEEGQSFWDPRYT
jgi:hypothetical protein